MELGDVEHRLANFSHGRADIPSQHGSARRVVYAKARFTFSMASSISPVFL